MHAVWVDEGKSFDANKCLAHGITAPYFSHRFGNATKDILQAAANQGFKPGIYSAWNWYLELDGKAYAEFLSSELSRINWPGNPPLCVDIESGTFTTKGEWVAYVLAFLKRWRELRPSRETYWTLEGFQGGNFSPAQVSEIVARKVRVVPQMYGGAVEPLGHDVTIDMLGAGFPGSILDGFYDARALPGGFWRGFAFTQATLP